MENGLKFIDSLPMFTYSKRWIFPVRKLLVYQVSHLTAVTIFPLQGGLSGMSGRTMASQGFAHAPGAALGQKSNG